MESPLFGWTKHAQQMGQLARGDAQWDVYLEVQPRSERRSVRGRVHFVSGDRHRESAWIFLEWSERELRDRFNEFSATELWSLLESLGP